MPELHSTPMIEAKLGAIQALGGPLSRAVTGTWKDTRKFFKLRRAIKDLGHERAFAKTMQKHLAKSGASADRVTQNAKHLEKLSRKLTKSKTQYGQVAGRQAIRAGGAMVVASGVGYGAQAYRARRQQVRQRPRYREMDVYPEHRFAAVGATKMRRPYYDGPRGGREVAFRSPSLGEAMTLFEEKKRQKSSVTYQQMLKMHPSDFTPEQLARMERAVKADPKALKHYKFLRRLYKLGEGAKGAIWTAFLMHIVGVRAGTAMNAGAAAGGILQMRSGRKAPQAHRQALQKSFVGKLKRKEYAKSNRLMREATELSAFERRQIMERIINAQVASDQ